MHEEQDNPALGSPNARAEAFMNKIADDNTSAKPAKKSNLVWIWVPAILVVAYGAYLALYADGETAEVQEQTEYRPVDYQPPKAALKAGMPHDATLQLETLRTEYGVDQKGQPKQRSAPPKFDAKTHRDLMNQSQKIQNSRIDPAAGTR